MTLVGSASGVERISPSGKARARPPGPGARRLGWRVEDTDELIETRAAPCRRHLRCGGRSLLRVVERGPQDLSLPPRRSPGSGTMRRRQPRRDQHERVAVWLDPVDCRRRPMPADGRRRRTTAPSPRRCFTRRLALQQAHLRLDAPPRRRPGRTHPGLVGYQLQPPRGPATVDTVTPFAPARTPDASNSLWRAPDHRFPVRPQNEGDQWCDRPLSSDGCFSWRRCARCRPFRHGGRLSGSQISRVEGRSGGVLPGDSDRDEHVDTD
jgi:hypothetical protein